MRKIASVSPIGTDTFEGYYDLDEADRAAGSVRPTRARDQHAAHRRQVLVPDLRAVCEPEGVAEDARRSENDVEGGSPRRSRQKLAKTREHRVRHRRRHREADAASRRTAGTPARTSVANYRKIRQLTTGVSGGFAATKPGDKLIDMMQAVPSALRQGAVFAMNPLTAAEVRKLVDGQGNYLFIPDFSKNPNGSILGYGIAELNDMADIGANSLSIAFAQLQGRLRDQGSHGRHARAARSVYRQAVRLVLHDEARRWRRREFPGDHAAEVRLI
jgi:predicted phage gp36 major capsid-like protein